jgi:hypothetical protein
MRRTNLFGRNAAVSRVDGRSSTWNMLAVAISASLLLVPVLAVEIPPLLDYPNHLARLWMITGGIEIPPLSEMYALSWGNARTNVGIDYFAWLLGGTFAATTIGSMLVFLALVLPALGAVALNRALSGRWHWWQASFFFFAFCPTMLGAFLNFQIAIGLALLAASLEPAFRTGNWIAAAAARMCIGALIYSTHLFGACFYAMLVAAIAFGASLPASFSYREILDRVGKAAIPAASALLPVLVMLLSASFLPVDAEVAKHSPTMLSFSILEKLRVVTSPFRTYDMPLDAAFTAALFLVMLAFLWGQRVRLHFGLFLAACVLLLFSVVAPFNLFGTGFINLRFPIMAVLTLLAASHLPNSSASKKQMLGAALLLTLCTVRVAWISELWLKGHDDLKAVEMALADVPAGSAILPVDGAPAFGREEQLYPHRHFFGINDTYWHYPALAVFWRHAFVPMLFSSAGRHTLSVRPPWNEIATSESRLMPIDALVGPDPGYPFVQHWRDRFQYVIEVNAQPETRGDIKAALPELRLVADTGFARLYSINPRPRM